MQNNLSRKSVDRWLTSIRVGLDL